MKNSFKILGKLMIIISICMFLLPSIIYAQDLSEDLSNLSAEGSYTIKTDAQITSQSVLTFATKNGGSVGQTVGGNNWQTYTAYPNDNWKFAYWETMYKGPSTKGKNPAYDDDTMYFSLPDNVKKSATGSSNPTLRINKDYWAKGTYYIAAIFRPKLTVSCDVTDNTLSITETANGTTSSVAYVEQYVPYNENSRIFAALVNRVPVSVTVNGENFTNYTFSNGYALQFNVLVTRPTNISIKSRLKIQKVNFNANGGQGTMTTQEFSYGEAKNIIQNSFSKEKHSFKCWNTKSDGTGIVYSDKQLVTFNPENDGDSITLYAQWEALPLAQVTSAPKAKDLMYSQSSQQLILPGSTNQGTLMYSLEENGAFSDEIPTATNAGDYAVWYYVKGDETHIDSVKEKIDVTIKKATPDIGEVTANVVKDNIDISSVIISSKKDEVAGKFIIQEGQTLKLGDNSIKYVFTPNDSKNYNSFLGTVNVKVIDTIAPVGVVKITDAKTTWDKILETITFELYFNTDQKVTVEAADSFSGIKEIKYYETDEVLNLSQVMLLEDDKWEIMHKDGVVVSKKDAKRFIYYVKLMDKSGNVSYIASNGVEFDTTLPMIEGISDNATYYTSKKVTVTDKNLKSVTVNGNTSDYMLVLQGGKEETYVVEAVDKAGNSNSVTVKIMSVNDITDIDASNVTLENKTELINTRNELESALEENLYILSSEEKANIEDKIKSIDEALKIIENVENVHELIDNIPDNVKKSDKTEVDKAKEAYDKLTEYEKKLVDENMKSKLEKTVASIKEVINNPQTGDNIYLVVAIFGISAIGLVFTIRYGRFCKK